MGEPGGVRLAEILGALSLGIDLGFGQPMEHILRQCLIALRLADRLGLDERDRAAVYYTALLVTVGCHSDAHEAAKWFGDDIQVLSLKYRYRMRSIRGTAAAMSKLGSGSPLLHRFRIGLEFVVAGRKDLDGIAAHHAQMARLLAEQLGLPDETLSSLAAAYEQWDGKGWPGEASGDAIPLPCRVVQICEFTEVASRVGGIPAVRDLMRKRGGKEFDPRLAAVVAADAEVLLSDLDSVATWTAVIDAEPALARVLYGDDIDEALTAVADFVDLKSPYTLGHSRAVAELSSATARALTLAEDDVTSVRRAALVSNFGRLGISNSIWDKADPLGIGERERVRMHPYLTERMLHGSATLAPLGLIAVQLRERLDGSGYPHGLSGAAISRRARILGTADAYQAMREPRPYREALSGADAATQLRAEAKAGRLDGDVVEAVLGAAGHRTMRRREGPAGLTSREVQVLRLVARGLPNKDIASRLVISPKTVGNHIEHIYTKIGASSRASASLFAVQHGLLPEEEESVPA